MIKFVYFDLGGVVIRDFSGTDNWVELKNERGITDDYWDKFEPELCVGKQKIDNDLLNAFVSRFEKNPSIWPVIDKIHKSCKIGLLTNMYPGMFKAIQNAKILPDVAWSVIIDSSVEGIAKPDSEIFKLAEEKAQVKGQEILFVENSPGHVQAAKSFGWQTFLYDSAHPADSSQKLSLLLETE